MKAADDRRAFMEALDDYADAVAMMACRPGGAEVEAMRMARRRVVATFDHVTLKALPVNQTNAA